MKLRDNNAVKATMETEGRFQLTRREVFEMHLFDEDAAEERVHCGKDTTGTERRGVRGYLEDRLYGNRVGTVCQGCKDRAAPFTRKIIDDLEAEALLGVVSHHGSGRVFRFDDHRRAAGSRNQDVGLPSGVTGNDLRVLGAHPGAGKHALEQGPQDGVGTWLGLV